MLRQWVNADPMLVALGALGIAVLIQAVSCWSPAIACGAVAAPVLAGLGMGVVCRGRAEESGARTATPRAASAGLPGGNHTESPERHSQSAEECETRSEEKAVSQGQRGGRKNLLHEASVDPLGGFYNPAFLEPPVPLDEFVALNFDLSEESGDGIILQQWSRRLDGLGQEVLSGEVRLEYPDGARLAVAHVPWQPAFGGLPQVSLEAVDGDEAEVQIDMLRSYGMRLSARRREESSGFTVVAFHVQAKQSLRAAA